MSRFELPGSIPNASAAHARGTPRRQRESTRRPKPRPLTRAQQARRRRRGRRRADPRLMVVTCAEPLFLLSRVSSDAYEPYVFLKDHGEESLTPGGPLANPSS